MRVVLVVGRLGRFGSVLGAVALAKQLRCLGCDVTLVTLAHPDTWNVELERDLASAGVKVVSADSHRFRALFRPGRFARFLREQEPDVVCSYCLRPDFLNAVVRGPWVTVSSVRVLLGDAYRAQLGRIAGAAAVRIYRPALRRMDGVIGISRAICEWLLAQGLPPEKTFYVPNFLDEAWLNECLPDFPSTQDGIRAITIGKLKRHKRIDWAIRAVCEVARKHPELHLDVVGAGPLRGDLERLAAQVGGNGRVVFHGRVEDVRPLLRRAHLVLHTSLVEGIPRAMMEALALGKTSLAANIPGVDELILDGVSGYLFDQGSLSALTDRLESLVRDQAFLPPAQVRGYLVEHFDARAAGERTLAAFESILAARESEGVGRSGA